MFRSPLTGLSICLLAAGCAGQSAALPEPDRPRELATTPERLPEWLRPIVRTQMVRQREYVSELRWTAASLEFDRTSILAQRIVQEVQCGRPGEGSASLDGVIPAGYLDLQEKLRERAYGLSVAAASGNSHQVAGAYQSMLEVCARCHAVYRPGPPVELPLISEHTD
jgi:cytochrome c553